MPAEECAAYSCLPGHILFASFTYRHASLTETAAAAAEAKAAQAAEPTTLAVANLIFIP